MDTITIREAYDEVEVAFWRRARKTIGFTFGTIMCLASVVRQTPVLGFGLALSTGLITGALTGVMFAWIWSWFMRRSSRRFLDRVFAGDPTVVGNAPANRTFKLRIPCSVFLTSNVTVGGVLYIDRAGLCFVPHRRYRNEPTIGIDADGMVVWARDWKPNWWGRLFVMSAPRVLEIRSGEQIHRFALPDADSAVPRIRGTLGQ